LRVLISAYACEPFKGSEPGVGWNWVLQIARFHEVWVITRQNNRASIERKLDEEPIPNAHFVYVDLPRWARFWKKGSRGVHFYYYLWQLHAFFAARKLHKTVAFDVGHHVTFVNDWTPTFLCLLPFPFVWGPVGGSTNRAPLRFWSEFGLRGMAYEAIRTAAILGGRYLDPFVWLTQKKAGWIIAMSEAAASGFPASTRNKVLPLGNVGFSLGELPNNLPLPSESPRNDESRDPLLLSAGRLVHWKGYSVLLKACADIRRGGGRLELWIAGSGPDEPRLRRLTTKLGIQDCVKFLGFLPDRDSVFDHLIRCDIFVMPTFHDGPPVIFLEAMAMGKPVICLDLGGASEIITPACGVKLKAHSPRQVIHDLAQAIRTLGYDGELRARLGAAGRRRAEMDFSWNKKGDLLTGLYEKIVYRVPRSPASQQVYSVADLEKTNVHLGDGN
jgi:glycosyltransferase involved in cell wall biosynthesis